MNSAFVQVLTAIAMVLTIVVPMTYYFKGEHNKNRYKKSLAANVSGFFGLLLIATVVSFAGATTASAATEADGYRPFSQQSAAGPAGRGPGWRGHSFQWERCCPPAAWTLRPRAPTGGRQ